VVGLARFAVASPREEDQSELPTPSGVRRLRQEALLDWTTGGIVLLVYGIVQLEFLLGPQPFDPSKYFETALDFPDVPADLFTLRIGLVAPVRAAVLGFGPSEAALYAVPIASGLVLAAAVYGTLLLLFRDRLLAAAAALVTVLNTNYLQKSSSIFPDTAATATVTAGFFCLVLGAARSEEQKARWAPTVAAAGAGILFGWTYLIREFSLVLFPAVLAVFVLLRYPLRRATLVVGAAFATATLELLYGFLEYREPFIHARLLLGRGERRIRPGAYVVEHVQEQVDNLRGAIVLFPRLLLGWGVGWVFLMLLGIFVLALILRLRDKRLQLLAAWCFSFWIIMAGLGLGSLRSGLWILNTTNIRYWLPIFPPLVMGAFGGLAVLIPRRAAILGGVSLAHMVAAVLAALAVVPGLVEFRHCAAMNVWPNDSAERWHDLRSWFATGAAERYDGIWTDEKTQRLVPAFASTTFGGALWDGTIEDFPDARPRVPATDLEGSLILIHKDRLTANAQGQLKALRREWSPIFISNDGEMVLLAHTPPAGNAAVEGQESWWSLESDQTDVAEPGTCGQRP
jgi:hypothetical protein